MSKTFLFTIALLAAACGTNEDKGVNEEKTEFSPSEGIWTLTAPEITENTCNYDTPAEERESRVIITNTAVGFTLTDEGEDETDGFSCILTGYDFDCGRSTAVEEYDETSITITIQTTGSFSSETSLEINIRTDVSCEGDYCETIEDSMEAELPCVAASTGTAEFLE